MAMQHKGSVFGRARPGILAAIAATALMCIGAHAASAQQDPVTIELQAPGSLKSLADGAGRDVSGRQEPADAGFRITLDEHLLVNSKRDMDYNGGGEVAVSGARAVDNWFSIDRALGAIDRLDGLGALTSTHMYGPTHAFAAGVVIFTPGDLHDPQPIPGDRPYASLMFLSNGRRYVLTDRAVAYDSSLTVGLLGLAAAESLQRSLHRITGSVQPQGWAHQISAGGEPTARYSFARQSLLGQHVGTGGIDLDRDSTWTVAGSVGTITEGSIAFNSRSGRIRSPWWTTSPEQSMYVDEARPAPPPLGPGWLSELFLLTGARLKVRVYNAFLEGQFRHSDLRYGASDLNTLLGEAWVGVEFRNSSGLEFRYLSRWESPELRHGIGSRSFVWGSIEVSKAIGQR